MPAGGGQMDKQVCFVTALAQSYFPLVFLFFTIMEVVF